MVHPCLPNAKPHPNFIKMSFVTYSVGSQCEALWAEDGKHYPLPHALLACIA